MARLSSGVRASILVVGLPLSHALATQAQSPSLEGTWHTVSIERNGHLISDPAAIKGMQLTFAGDVVSVLGLYGNQTERCRFTTNGTVSPSQLDWTRPNGTVVKMLYELKSGNLRIAFAFLGDTERPKAISGASGSKAIVMTFKRAVQ